MGQWGYGDSCIWALPAGRISGFGQGANYSGAVLEGRTLGAMSTHPSITSCKALKASRRSALEG